MPAFLHFPPSSPCPIFPFSYPPLQPLILILISRPLSQTFLLPSIHSLLFPFSPSPTLAQNQARRPGALKFGLQTTKNRTGVFTTLFRRLRNLMAHSLAIGLRLFVLKHVVDNMISWKLRRVPTLSQNFTNIDLQMPKNRT